MKTSLIGVAAAVFLASSAYSADLYQPEPQPIDAPEVTVQEASGWYLRGDVGYSFNKLKGANYFQGSNALLNDFDDASLKDSFSLGAGVGYQVNNYLRTDLTFDYMFKSDFHGRTFGVCGDGDAQPFADCSSSDETSLRAYTLMANAYVDLGTYGYFTPYVGAGIGGAYVKWNNLKNSICDDPYNPGCTTTTHNGKGSWRFAYALMAGATIDVTCNIKADAGYRYRHIEGGDMFGYNNSGGPGYDKGLDSHELRLGARYVFSGCEQPVAYEPPMQPLVYK